MSNVTKVVDASVTDGDSNAVIAEGAPSLWQISTASVLIDVSLAQGNNDATAVNAGSSNTRGDTEMIFANSIVNTTTQNAVNPAVAINLPAKGDSQGSTYTFKLTGPVSVPEYFTVASGTGLATNATVLYSTNRYTNRNATSIDTAGYLTENQVTDWSLIQSVIIEVADMTPVSSTGRIQFFGTVDDFITQSQTIGFTQSLFFVNGSSPLIEDKAASLSISGTSTILARMHYVDSDGQDQYIDLSDMSKTLTDNVDTFEETSFNLKKLSDIDTALIPDGYYLQLDDDGSLSKTIVNSSLDNYGDNLPNETAEFGSISQYYFDGDIVQYELLPDIQTATIEFVDDQDHYSVVESTTILQVKGKVDTTANWSVTSIPKGYVLSDGQSDSGTYTFTLDAHQVVQIHLTHHVTDGTAQTNRTIMYVVANDQVVNPTTVTQVFNYKTVTDDVTGESYATAQNRYAAVDSPAIAGYTPDLTTVEASYPAPSATDSLKDSEVMVTYAADQQSVTVEYVDDQNNGVVVGTPITMGSVTNGTVAWDSKTMPKGYVLSKGQSASGTHPVTAAANQVVQIHLTHHVTDGTAQTNRTIMYVVANDQVVNPTTVTQVFNYKTVTDDVTGESYATAQNRYAAVDSPVIAGCTPDLKTVEVSYPAPSATDSLKDREVTVTYTADQQSVTVEYVDDQNSGAVVGTPIILKGVTDGTVSWNSENIPEGYELSEGQSEKGTYKVTAARNQIIKIHLTKQASPVSPDDENNSSTSEDTDVTKNGESNYFGNKENENNKVTTTVKKI